MPRLALVKQETNFDCGVACMAMVLGVSLAEANQIVGRDLSVPHEAMRLYKGIGETGEPEQIGLLGEEMVAILFKHGYPAIHMYAKPTYTEWMQAAFEDLHLIGIPELVKHTIGEGGAAIIGVPSLRFDGQFHWIVSDGGEILDPGRGPKLYQTSDDLTVCQFVLVGDKT